MIWWAKTRRVPLLGATVVANGSLVALLGGSIVPSIGLRFSSASIAGAAITPILVNCTVQLAREKLDLALEGAAVRKIRLFDLELMVVLALAIAGCAATARAAAGDRFATEGARNALGYLGIGLVVSRVAGTRIAAAAPAFYVFLLALFSTAESAQRSLLTWPLHGGDSGQALAVALMLFAGGLAAVAGGTPRAPTAD